MALKKYIGARYTPKFMGAWDAQTVYAALSVVYANEQSYVSRKTVPAGTELSNTEYWVKSADWNAQVAEYNRNVENYNKNVVEYNKNVVAYEQAVNTFYADTLHSYDTKAAMVADQDLKLGDTLLTCGNTAIGDGGGSFYQVVAETSAKAVALENGLYALPFEFQPYDFSEFQTEVDNYKADTDQKIQTFENTVKQDVAQMKEVSLHTYNTQNQMKADRTLTPNTVVMTAGEAAVGDNKGSFYEVQETSDKTDAVPLDNGRKAVPFALNVGTVAGNALTFNGKSEVAGIWNVKAPASLTIPLTIPQGGTALTYLAVLYSGSASVNANVVVNGTGKTLTFSDAPNSGFEKFVVYAITCKNTDQIYWSQTTVSSWQTEYRTVAIDYSTKLGANAPQPFNVEYDSNYPVGFNVTPSKKIHLDTIVVNAPKNLTSVSNNPHLEIMIKHDSQTVANAFAYDFTSNIKTFNINADLEANTTYSVTFNFYEGDLNTGNHYYGCAENVAAKYTTYDLLALTRRHNGYTDGTHASAVFNYTPV